MIRKEQISLLLVLSSQVVAQSIFGSYGVVLKYFAQQSSLEPSVFSLLRAALAVPFLFGLSAVVERQWLIPTPAESFYLALLGLVGMGFNQVTFMMGVYACSASIAAIIGQITPSLTLMLSVLYGTEELSLRHPSTHLSIVAIVLASLGAAIMILSPAPAIDPQYQGKDYDTSKEERFSWIYLTGLVALLISGVFYSCYVVFQKKFVFFITSDSQNRYLSSIFPPVCHYCKDFLVTFCGGRKLDFPSTIEMLPVERSGIEVDQTATELPVLAMDNDPSLGSELSPGVSITDSSKEGREKEQKSVALSGQDTVYEPPEACSMPVSNNVLIEEASSMSSTTVIPVNDILGSKNPFFPPCDRWRSVPILATAYIAVFGTISLLLPVVVRAVLDPKFLFNQMWSGMLVPMSYAVIGNTVVGYSLVSVGNRFLRSSTVTSFLPLQVRFW